MKKYMKKGTVLAGLIVAFALVGIMGSQQAYAADPIISCHIEPAANRTIVSFNPTYANGPWLLANEFSLATAGPFSASLAPGSYRVWLEAYDSHFENGGQNQNQEQYYLTLNNASGGVIAFTGASQDISNSSDYSGVKMVNASLAVSRAVSSLTARHAAPTNVGPQSHVPVCAAFDRLVVSTPTPTPSPIPQPSINAFCSGSNARATITWSEAGRGSGGYYIDLDDDNNWGNGFWNKFVSGNTSTQAPDGFTRLGSGAALTLASNATYYVRIFYAAGGQHSPTASFGTPNCAPQNPTLTITKLASNITRGSGESDVISARPHDTMEFAIRVRNTGNSNANNVRISDILPAGLTYQSGSSDTTIGTLAPGEQTTMRFRATVREDSYFGTGTTRLTNVARTWADNVSQLESRAYVDVTRDQTSTLVCNPSSQNVYRNDYVSFSSNGGSGFLSWFAGQGNPSTGSGSSFSTRFSESGTYDIRVTDGTGQQATCRVFVQNVNQGTIFVDKLVRNITTDTGETNSVPARPNDTLEFVIRVTTSGSTTLNNLRVWDTLPSGLTYLSGDNLVGNGIYLGSTYGNQTLTYRFRARVADTSYFPTSVTSLTNIAYASADTIGTVSDSAFVTVSGTNQVPNGPISIQKFGRNISKGEFQELTHINANPGDTIDFLIRVRNTSSTTQYNVIVRDQLPGQLQYLVNTTAVNNNALANNDSIIGNGINVGTLTPGQEVVVRFDAVVRGAESFSTGLTSINNVAYVRADNIAETSAYLPLSIRKGSVLGQIGGVKTGATSMTILTLALASLLALTYMAYTRTGLFRRREALALAGQMRTDKDKFNFAR